jgi:uncharacterized protein (TIGR03437 family)
MLRGLLLLFFLSANQAFSGSVQPLAGLPASTFVNAVQVDSSGYIYVAGQFYPGLPTSSTGHAFVAKISPDGSQLVWWTVLSGSQNDTVQAMALGSDNSIYVTGKTNSADFPTTRGALQIGLSANQQAFAAKLNPGGIVAYATYVGGPAATMGTAIAADSSGNAYITGFLGTTGFPTSPGAVVGTSGYGGTAFIIELNAAGSAAPVAIAGFGGTAIAVDAQGNIYAAGSFEGPVPTTPGAFQTTTAQGTCETGNPGGIGPALCPYQHIAKIDPTGTKLIFATYISGYYGATPTGIAVDASGNVIVAGTTNSPDYPTTPAAYQPEYFANPQLVHAGPFLTLAPASAGYVTKLNASGSGLIWSTLYGGSGTGDAITAMGLDPNGNILLAGHAASTDLPGLWLTPVASRPPQTWEGFVARLSPDGATLSPTELVATAVNVTGIAARPDGSAVVIGYGSNFASGVAAQVFASVSISPLGRVAAITDTADNAKIVSVAPGQLLTLYGTNLAPGPAFPATRFPTSFSGVTVTFNGIAAPILYTSGIQINLQVPYEIAGQTEVTMQISSQQVSPAVSESYVLAVVERQPSIVLSSAAFGQPLFDIAACNGPNISGLQPLALNADGTQNSCANPAASGSVVTIFLNGLGVSNPAQQTGVISPSLVSISPTAALVSGSTLPTATLPGSIDSLAQVQIQVSSTSSVLNIPLEVQQLSESPFLVRGPGILIWVHQ